MDYLFHKYDTHLVYGGNRLSFGNSFIYLALGVIIFFAGFRFEIGYDYANYMAGYLYDSELGKWEPFFNFFVRLSRELNFGLESQFMFLFFSTMTILILYMALRRLTPYYRLGILLYILIPAFYLNTFSVIRQGISMVILLYGFKYIVTEHKEYKKYIVTAFVAFMFHYSSIFLAATYIIGAKFFQRTYSTIAYIFLIAISFFLSFAHVSKYILLAMPGHFEVYGRLVMPTSPLKILLINVFFLFFILQKKYFVKNELHRYILNSMFLGLIIFNLFSDFNFVSRMGQYFLLVEIILVPIYLYSIKDHITRKILFTLFLTYYLFNFNYALYRDGIYRVLRSNHHTLTPYRNYFFEEKKSDRNLNIEAWYNYVSESQEQQEGNK